MLSVAFLTILKIFALGFLIFIHELGHYFAARWVGMRVETFSIGMLKPIYSWERNGTKWQICWLLFGGFVKIGGTDAPEGTDPYAIKDGFFGKKPIERIFVALAGPVANLLFALLAFTGLWAMGGLSQNYVEHTRVIGWVDPNSELYQHGVRAGDEITAYNNSKFTAFQDHIEMPMTSGDTVTVSGNKVNYTTKERTPFEYTVSPYPHPVHGVRGLKTAGITNSANYVIYDKIDGKDNPISEHSPLLNSGIEYGDRIAWLDGEPIFSTPQLNKMLNEGRVLLTVARNDKTFLRRVPRVKVQELKLDQAYKDELTDWQYEAKLKSEKLQQLYMIPYNLTNDGVVESPFKMIDGESESEAFPTIAYSANEEPLQEGDRIIAVDGQPVKHSYQILSYLQSRHVQVIVEKVPFAGGSIAWDKADEEFDKQIDLEALSQIAASIGTGKTVNTAGNYKLLKPIVPISRLDFAMNEKGNEAVMNAIEKRQREIANLADPEQKAAEQKSLEQEQNEVILGIPVPQDRKVNYNPGPLEMFQEVVQDVWRFIKALFSFNLSFKWVAGPIGILQSSPSASWGIGNALDWLAFISINLGILNLLPIPVLDGGTIVLSTYEMLTGHQIKPKTMERLILPFALVLITFFVFVTLNDINRLFNFF